MLCTPSVNDCQWMKSPGAVNLALALYNLTKLRETFSLLNNKYVEFDNQYDRPPVDEVSAEFLKRVCDLYLGDISLRKFVTELRWDDYQERFDLFTRRCLSHFGDISSTDVYWVYRKTARMLRLIASILTGTCAGECGLCASFH